MTAGTVTASAAESAGGTLTRAGELFRFALRRDRVRMPAWVLGIAAVTVLTAVSFPGIYPDASSRAVRAQLMSNPAAIAMGGPRIGMDNYTFGAMMTNEMLGYVVLTVALMAIFTVVRYTRADEESGRTELVLASAVGRHAPLASALTLAVIASLAVGLLTGIGLGMSGVESLDWPGALLFGAAVAAGGCFFAGVAALAAQVTEHSRTASALSGLVLGVGWALRAVGDNTVAALSWLSPIGWAQRTYAFVDDRWWPLLIPLALGGLLMAGAAGLSARRDLGAGLRQPRPGPGAAAGWLSRPLGLPVRLQGPSFLGWAVSMLSFGLLYGSLIAQVTDFIDKMPESVIRVLGGVTGEAAIRAFLALITLFLAVVSVVFGVNAVTRARSEETGGLAENVLATPVSRAGWAGGHALVGGLGCTLVLWAGALGMGVSGSLVGGDWATLGYVMAGALAQTAPMLLLVGLGLALLGWVPRLLGLIWVPVGYAMFSGMLGGLLNLPSWALNLSPFHWMPLVPSEPWRTLPVVLVLLGAAVLAAAGLVGLRRRDLQSGG